jgi:DNA-binding SARP family transcriptional activator
MEFRILGPLEVLDEGRRVALASSKQRALLALLLLHRGETLGTERLIDELWGERPPATAAKSVQGHISRLRKALAPAGSELIVTRDHGYELAIDRELVDAERFERLVGEGRSELASGDAERAAAALEEALSLWRGRPLDDLAYEPFAQGEIARLDQLRVAALEQLIEAKLALGHHAELVGQLEALVAEHPYRERLWGQLMLALYRCERQADALQAYQDARRTSVEWGQGRAPSRAHARSRVRPRRRGTSRPSTVPSMLYSPGGTTTRLRGRARPGGKAETRSAHRNGGSGTQSATTRLQRRSREERFARNARPCSRCRWDPGRGRSVRATPAA